MNLSEWRKLRTEGEAATLPSGLDVRLKRVGAMDLAEKGQIPQEMRPQLEKIIAGQQTRNVTIEEFESFSGVINIVCAACLVGPEGLEVSELSYDDRLAIFKWANEVSGKLDLFRQQNGKPVESAFAVGDVRPAAQRVPRAGA